jgi:tetratricopeptide (TPR) repeat protein
MFKVILNSLKPKKAKSDLNRIHTDTGSNLRQMVIESEKEASKNNFTTALSILEKVIEIDPKYEYAYGDKALILDSMGKLDESIDMYSKALELNPNNAITWHNKALTLIKQRKIYEAISCFDEAIAINQEYSKAWYNKGRCLEMQGKTTNAQSCLTMAKKLDPFLFSKIKLRS